ncbi:MAG: 1-(5-phosphoribosyl)-5-[(5-phosphoribosylamino)methylideneamino]imidazole-4-carboxamide isomerase [Deltaproteobacteria bacterium CG11_big_fil_rev_8_21_14_0_20_47_16]|nr:MAG: 1-(5-phosphoribosyl)-5-[(5-phosphoribosylamino)methylideneamino]imidazole-4-carboxamide isomerase [Deltaproteobacteria bacterium CG11_big_fil_rev_8_21_14_0_20_47_16]
MEVFPAIDVIGGQCVRLTQGQYDQVTTYGDSPETVMGRYKDAGVSTVHVVDLDGAKQGQPVNQSLILQLATVPDVSVQVGGGIRSLEQAAAYLDAGVARVILSTAAIETPEILTALISSFGSDRIMVSLDHRHGQVLTRGWLAGGDASLESCVPMLQREKISWLILTDVARDGTLTSVSPFQCDAIANMANKNFKAVAAGGVTTLDDIRSLHQSGATAVIVGKALAEGRLQLADCLKVAGETAC